MKMGLYWWRQSDCFKAVVKNRSVRGYDVSLRGQVLSRKKMKCSYQSGMHREIFFLPVLENEGVISPGIGEHL